MWRAFFLAVGIYLLIAGAECLAVDKAILNAQEEPVPGFRALGSTSEAGRRREVAPPQWAPWSLMSAGAVTILYSFTIPKRVKE